MAILFIFFAFILAIILVARLASKARPKEEREKILPKTKVNTYAKGKQESQVLDALVALLVRKGMISEEELVAALRNAEKHQAED